MMRTGDGAQVALLHEIISAQQKQIEWLTKCHEELHKQMHKQLQDFNEQLSDIPTMRDLNDRIHHATTGVYDRVMGQL
jgi:phosphopantothenate synthetase